MTPDFDIEKNPNCVVTGDFPDIDLDYIKVVRDYLKNEWAPKTFGEEHVCNIGNYTTFGIKSALIDMARVHGLPRGEILELTK
jgi:DNA polymerase III alpha subunit